MAEQEEDSHPSASLLANDPQSDLHCASHKPLQIPGPLPHDILQLDVQVLLSHTLVHEEPPQPTPHVRKHPILQLEPPQVETGDHPTDDPSHDESEHTSAQLKSQLEPHELE